MRHHHPVRVALCLVHLTAGLAVAQPAARPTYGAESPQAAVAIMQKAGHAGDLAAAVPVIAPAGRKELAKEGVEGLLMVLAFSDPDDAMPGSKPLPKAELEKKREAYRSVVDLTKKTLEPYGMAGLIGKPAMASETQKALAAALAAADTVAVNRDLLSAMERIGPMLGMEKSEKSPVPFDLGTVTGYEIKGDKATAKSGKETIDFERIDGRWYLTPPQPKKP